MEVWWEAFPFPSSESAFGSLSYTNKRETREKTARSCTQSECHRVVTECPHRPGCWWSGAQVVTTRGWRKERAGEGSWGQQEAAFRGDWVGLSASLFCPTALKWAILFYHTLPPCSLPPAQDRDNRLTLPNLQAKVNLLSLQWITADICYSNGKLNNTPQKLTKWLKGYYLGLYILSYREKDVGSQ